MIAKLKFLAMAWVLAEFFSANAKAIEWSTKCGRSSGEILTCRIIKGDAVLAGRQGVLNTIVFPDGERRQYFYSGGTVEELGGLRVRKYNAAWMAATGMTTQENRLYFRLPSGNIFMWISAYTD
jgi:hypothetical protein